MHQALNGCVEVARVSKIHQTSHLKDKTLLSFKMETLYPKFQQVIHKYKNHPHVEIEFRLGKVNRGSFDTNVGEKTYMKVLEGLMMYKGWEKSKVTHDQIFYGEGGRRAVNNIDSDETTRAIKTKLVKVDHVCEGRPLDVRLGVSTEVPCEPDEDEVYTESKERTRYSFIRKNLSIDVSMIKGTPDDPDCDKDTQYQIELEIIDPSKVTDDNVLYPIVNKVFDLMNVA